MSVQPRSRLYVAIITGLLASSYGLVSTSSVLAAEQTVARKTRTLGGQTYTFTKTIDAEGNVRGQITDGSGKVVSETDAPRLVAPLVEPRALAALTKLEQSKLTDQTLRVEVALRLPEDSGGETPETIVVEMEGGRWVKGFLNNQEISEAGMAAYADRHGQDERAARARRSAIRAQSLLDWASRHGLIGQKGVEDARRQSRSGMRLDLTAKQLRTLIGSRDPMLAGIELYEPGQDDIANAMDATSITPAALANPPTRGNGIGIYMTESGCPDESRITNYDRLSGSETDHSQNVGAILRAVSPESFIYCRGGDVLPEDSDLDGVNGNAPIHIVTQSASSNDSTSYNTTDHDWDNFTYHNKIATFNSAGNTGEDTGNIRSPGKGLNVITVGNYDDANATINSTSPYVNPETGNDKPEISAPGTTVTAGGFTFTGTSQSTPHAAAFAADIMSHKTIYQYRPWLVKAKLLAGATDPIGGGYDQVGQGGIDFSGGHWNGFGFSWQGGTSAFATYDGQDGAVDSCVARSGFISSSWDQVQVALSWLTRGGYTYDHRADLIPIGDDLDLHVYDPSGVRVGYSTSIDNPFEVVTFIPSVSGIYTFKICRVITLDPDLKLRMGLSVNYYDQ
ncbi:MAG TPA: hypothetical protein DIC59_01180 [Candidatus Competibacteraceae bacterium]|nr:hypothetical protein [Candidatus Competibacteraceae bacterium]